ncbi:MAG: AEC family transporter [Alphaproteobacteria bacterium]|nr:AEC family transporter [Alphaproteobacteria bacterium]
MNSVLTTVLPVFGLIVLGYLFAKAKVIDAAAGRGLALFVFNVAIPAFLFRTMATLSSAEAAPWGLWAAFFGGLAIAWVVAALVARRIASLKVSGGAAAAMATGFGNVGLLGGPLAMAHFGEGVGVPLGLILSVHAPILWTAATLHREMARNAGGPNWASVGRELLKNLGTNAIVLALIAGALWRVTGLGLHPIPDKTLAMLGDASVPTALFALGVSLSAYSLKGAWDGMFALIGLKMFLVPLLVYVLSHFVFQVPAFWARIAVLFAAMPTGANAFLFAQKNDEAVPAVSGAVALGTGLAALTASVLLYLIDTGWM